METGPDFPLFGFFLYFIGMAGLLSAIFNKGKSLDQRDERFSKEKHNKIKVIIYSLGALVLGLLLTKEKNQVELC